MKCHSFKQEVVLSQMSVFGLSQPGRLGLLLTQNWEAHGNTSSHISSYKFFTEISSWHEPEGNQRHM